MIELASRSPLREECVLPGLNSASYLTGGAVGGCETHTSALKKNLKLFPGVRFRELTLVYLSTSYPLYLGIDF